MFSLKQRGKVWNVKLMRRVVTRCVVASFKATAFLRAPKTQFMRYRKNKNLWPYLHILCYDSFSPFSHLLAEYRLRLLLTYWLLLRWLLLVFNRYRFGIRAFGRWWPSDALRTLKGRKNKNKNYDCFQSSKGWVGSNIAKSTPESVVNGIILHKFISGKRRVWLIRYLRLSVWKYRRKFLVKTHESFTEMLLLTVMKIIKKLRDFLQFD